MSLPLEHYGLIGDTETVALVSRAGSIDWLCFPRFDAPACFAALLGDESNGRWVLGPRGEVREVRRRYRPHTLVLETELTTDEGTVRLVDSMPPHGTQRGEAHDVVRVVEGVSGRVEMQLELVIRFDYGWVVPWVRRLDGRLQAVAGPDALTLTTPVETRGEDLRTVAEFTVAEGERVPFVLAWHPSHEPPPVPVDALSSLEHTTRWWRDWSAQSSYGGPWAAEVERSLITLKALTYRPTGGIVAAPTTSLPERLGGARNWDYRYVWLRDATLTLSALLRGGQQEEAVAWRDWLLRAVAGDPHRLQIMYGLAGERRLPELELPWLPGYEHSAPVRVGNAASTQVQLDIYGEVMDAMHYARRAGIEPDPEAWAIQRELLDHLEGNWREPGHGIWEVRGEPQHFTYGKVMTWVAFDRAVRAVERSGLGGPLDRWRQRRDEIHADVCANGYDAERNHFTQTYAGSALDASLLLIPQVGFLPPDDPRVVGTVEAVEAELGVGGAFVHRYDTRTGVDGLPAGEASFLLCAFWLVDALAMVGRREEAEQRFERLCGVANDVGLFAEEYDVTAGRQLGNFPQAFSHVGLVNSACNLGPARSPAAERSEREED